MHNLEESSVTRVDRMTTRVLDGIPKALHDRVRYQKQQKSDSPTGPATAVEPLSVPPGLVSSP